MKKIIFFLLLFPLCSASFAQMNVVITDAGGAVVNGTTLNYWVPCIGLDARYWDVTNAAGTPISVKVKKTVISLNDPGALVYFCTGTQCYSPTQNLSDTIVLAGSAVSLLTTDFDPNGVVGLASVRYTVLSLANPNDSAFFIINYNVSCSPIGISQNFNAKPVLSNPSPNPASAEFSINYNLGSTISGEMKLVVYNILGTHILAQAIKEIDGTIKMDVSSLNQGIYICSLESEGKSLVTRRFVVTH